jgi:hypothetical protein
MIEPYLIDLPKIIDKRGNLSFIEGYNHIPFNILRTYWIYDVPSGESRGGHAYKDNEEFVVALSGSFEIILNNGIENKVYKLNRSYFGLYIPKMYWREMQNFSTNSLALILSSTEFSNSDYIREYQLFIDQLKRETSNDN